MSATLQIEVKDEASPAAKQFAAGLKSSDLRAVMAKALKIALQGHLQKLDGERANALGGRRTHFYAQAGQSVNQIETGAAEIQIAISQVGFAQRYFGGTIRAGTGTSSFTGRPTKYLAIPARSESYGKRPGEFSNLHFIAFRSGSAALVESPATKLAKQRGGGFRSGGSLGGAVVFWLVKEVTQKADPSVLPEEDALLGAAVDAAAEYLDQIGQGGGSPP